jgi:hypothetical protein
MNEIGRNFAEGGRKIGRRRLPEGFVAITDDARLLRAAIGELHAYAVRVAGQPQDPCGIVFRVVTPGEGQAIRYRIINLRGVEWDNEHGHEFTPPAGHWHVLDLDALIHACNRHSNQATERRQGQLALACADCQRIPEIINPHWIRGLGFAKGMPRIVYERDYADGRLLAVEEIRPRQGLVVKTLYKRRP